MKPSSSRKTTKPKSKAKPAHAPLRILVVEDSPTQAERLRLVIEGGGYKVDVAGDGRAGLAAVRASAPDLVISDVVMPVMDGYELCKAIKSSRETRQIPVVLLTAQRNPSDIIRGLERGADNFITKPFEDEHLLERIRRIFEHLEHRNKGRFEMEVAIRVGGHEIVLNADKQQMIELLFATSEELSDVNEKLEDSRRVIEEHARTLEERVRERTAELATAEAGYRTQAQQQAAVALLGRRALEGVALQTLMNDAVSVVVQTLSVEFAAVLERSADDRSLLLRAGAGWNPGVVGQTVVRREQKTQADFTLLVGGPVIAEDLAAEKRFAIPKVFLDHGAVSSITVPIGSADRPFGVLGAQTRHARRFTDDDVHFLTAVAHVIAAAVEQERGRESLLRSEERFRQVVEASPTGILSTDIDGRIVLVNAAIERMFGYSRDELVGQPVELLVPESARTSHVGYRERFAHDPLDRRMGQRRELRGRRKDGSAVLLEIGLIHFDSAQGPMILATIVDVTERRTLEDHLQQAQKMEAVGRLAGGVAHDFNNVLAVIMIVGELALRNSPAGSPIRGQLEEIMKAARRAADLTRQMLAFSRKQVLHPRALELNGVVEGTRKMLGQVIGEDVELVVRLNAGRSTVLVDTTQIEQVLMNLVVNARDAMPKGGTLTVETSNVQLDEEYVRSHATGRPGSYVLLAISDTGVGMDEATRSHIFEPFFTTKPEGKGTGLGLATVYGIVKQSGGFIWVYSEPGQGATFKIYLPSVEAPKPKAEFSENEPGDAPRGTETILVVEDQEALRKITQAALERQGYAVLAAEDAEEALEIAGRHRGSIDLLLTDVVMPGMDGRTLAERLSSVRPEVRVLFMSGYSNGTISDRGLLAEGVNLLEKPFTATTLLQTVQKVLREGTK